VMDNYRIFVENLTCSVFLQSEVCANILDFVFFIIHSYIITGQKAERIFCFLRRPFRQTVFAVRDLSRKSQSVHFM
jgi:hypothetical protein